MTREAAQQGTAQDAAADPFHRVNVRVQWADTDAAGVVWFGNFFRFFEQAEDELFRSLGRTRLQLMSETGVLMPRVNATCRFFSPARAEELLDVGVAVADVAARRISYEFVVHEHDSGRLVAEGSYQVACVSPERFKGVDCPPVIRRLLEPRTRLFGNGRC
jgi:acyl-CoA thioester hydrolase